MRVFIDGITNRLLFVFYLEGAFIQEVKKKYGCTPTLNLEFFPTENTIGRISTRKKSIELFVHVVGSRKECSQVLAMLMAILRIPKEAISFICTSYEPQDNNIQAKTL